ncbi:MAG: OsmC family protein [Flavobacterium sp.]|nr:OsmC family protein [Flavobacterium sp.]
MSTKIVNITGFSIGNEQFVAKTESYNVLIGTNENEPELNAPSPIEYILAGYAGCINAVGTLVAQKLNLNLRSLQVAISGEINVDRFLGKPTNDRAGFKVIVVTINPGIEATEEQLKKWLSLVESRCPVYDNLSNATQIEVNLITENLAEVNA